MTTTTQDILTIPAVMALSVIAEAASRGARVARVTADSVFYGTARSIGTPDGGFIRTGEDIRDATLRVTLKSGWDAYWPIQELMDEVLSHQFCVYDWA